MQPLLATNAYFKSTFSKHRCLIPVDGWYEWIKSSKPKQPHFICRKDRRPQFLAGSYAERDDGSMGCAIVTELRRGSVAGLDDDSLKHWLAPDVIDRESIRSLVRHINAVLIEHWPVNTSINKPAEGQGSELINPA
ncbi:SOS response-associated peptidase family protein [Vreelandella arctica]|uniref:SOS response-associated peptidase family protein n=1 Tax=Vreelandella arctica TaxID=3126499 RepID=UPI00300DF05D|tara:strand:- start:335 stop:742 length:408 start_codon:yes stop_codon:yes gene_type:complete